ncbi:Putative transketolase N-terminal section [Paramagnetospirillum magneticum AMB-1]|uniref:Transketolase N-terminal section n=2 Tax=Paramagnetospirillum magneticum TaxID=84159 RepID=Q2WBA5_PARM1|nr:Putative transketolase N-terminal section [Paramagnetospirillum magneticum AMB-1]
MTRKPRSYYEPPSLMRSPTMTHAVPLPALDERSMRLRRLVIQALDGGGRGHLGSSLSLIEIVRVLYDEVMNHRPAEPRWEGRDRFILSKGHGCLALYAILADKGYFPEAELARFCRNGSYLGGHPEAGKIPGVEASTGALGHGLSIGVGMALGLRIKASAARVFVAMGDGEINEGSVWEAAMAAGKHRLANLTALVDYNKIQSYGFVSEVQPLEPLADKWRAFGFAVEEIDGHDVAALHGALSSPDAESRPKAVICHTVKGRGVPFAENDPKWHHKSNIPAPEIAAMYAALETI